MARLLTVEAAPGFARGCKVPFCTAFAAGFGLARVPDTGEFAGNKRLARNRPVENHSRGANPIVDSLGYSVSSEGKHAAIMR